MNLFINMPRYTNDFIIIIKLPKSIFWDRSYLLLGLDGIPYQRNVENNELSPQLDFKAVNAFKVCISPGFVTNSITYPNSSSVNVDKSNYLGSSSTPDFGVLWYRDPLIVAGKFIISLWYLWWNFLIKLFYMSYK